MNLDDILEKANWGLKAIVTLVLLVAVSPFILIGLLAWWIARITGIAGPSNLT